jgi:S-methylmethionine-dependent homocysteine/selenocysteine methylase
MSQQRTGKTGMPYLTDGGIETTLIFDGGWALPFGEAFTLLDSEKGITALREYYLRYIRLAIAHRTGFVLESPTWRANPDWGVKAGYDLDRLADVNRRAIALMRELERAHAGPLTPMTVSGCIGPRGDGYAPGRGMGCGESVDYHAWQIGLFRAAGADRVTAMTMTNINEAMGVALAAEEAGIPSVISFTLETDGRLPTGERLADAVEQIDMATEGAPEFYMINCAHPDHFAPVLEAREDWSKRIGGLRANASRLSHQELDNAPTLDTGNPAELGDLNARIFRGLPHLSVLGGCCGTDHRHVAEIARACLVEA